MHDERAKPRTPQHAPETSGRTIRWARFYDAASMLLTFGRAPAIRRTTVELAGLAPAEKVLDVGCGTGSLAIAVKAKAGATADVHGIDAAPEMIEVASRKAARRKVDVRFQVGLIEDIPFPDGQFDLALSTLMLHHLPDDLKRTGFAEIRRVLKPGGRFLAVDLASTGGGMFGHVMSLIGHKVAHDYVNSLIAMMKDAGFSDVEALETKHRQLAFIRARAQ